MLVLVLNRPKVLIELNVECNLILLWISPLAYKPRWRLLCKSLTPLLCILIYPQIKVVAQGGLGWKCSRSISWHQTLGFLARFRFYSPGHGMLLWHLLSSHSSRIDYGSCHTRRRLDIDVLINCRIGECVTVWYPPLNCTSRTAFIDVNRPRTLVWRS